MSDAEALRKQVLTDLSQTAAAQPAVLLHRPQHSESVTVVEELRFRPPMSQCGFEAQCCPCSATTEAQDQKQSSREAASGGSPSTVGVRWCAH